MCCIAHCCTISLVSRVLHLFSISLCDFLFIESLLARMDVLFMYMGTRESCLRACATLLCHARVKTIGTSLCLTSSSLVVSATITERSWSTDTFELKSSNLHEYTNLLEYDFGTTDGFKKWLLKWENQNVDLQKATSEVFSDRLKCAIVLSRSPAPIRTYLRVQNRGDYGALRVALMNFLEAEDDGHGPVPMEVGAMKGKTGDKDKKDYDKGKYGKSLGKYDKSNEYIKNNDYGKDSEKGKKEGRKAKEKDKEKTRNQRQTRVCKATAGHVANGDTRRVSVGKDTCKLWRKFRVLLRVQRHQVQQPHRRLRRQQRLFKNSMMSRNQDGSSAWWVDQWHRSQLACVGQRFGVEGMSICLVFEHQCE